ncbi:MAG: signal peptidase II [Ruminococcus sp.]|jgi:signal peptidase II|nr:signal peptidase II [Ruminococcus sp.]
MSKKIPYISLSAIAFLVIIDQIVKKWIIANVKDKPSKEFIHFGDFRVIDLTYVGNDGVIFGTFGGARMVITIVTAVCIVAAFYYLVKFGKMSKWISSSLTLILSGGIGNFIDRFLHNGVVIDYLEVKLFDFAVFNFADCMIVFGSIMLIIYMFFFEKSESVDKQNLNETKK